MSEVKTVDWLRWLERILLLTGMVFGIIAFVWQVQERIASNQEKFVAVLGAVTQTDDSLVILSVHILNSGRKPLTLRRLYLSDSPDRIQAQANYTLRPDSALPITIDPDEFVSVRSNRILETRIAHLADGAFVLAKTFRGEIVTPLNGVSTQSPGYFGARWFYPD